jgi:hypothetical protein
MGSNC